MRGKNIKLITIIVAATTLTYIIHTYGNKIPLIREIPHLSQPHKHEYTPVLDEEGKIAYWTCAMHPSVKMKDPGGGCPICGMDLVPVKKNNVSTPNKEQKKSQNVEQKTHEKHIHHNITHQDMLKEKESKEKSHKNHTSSAIFTVDTKRQQLINVKTEPIRVRDLTKIIRTVGTIKLDETRIEHVHIKFGGWIEKVFVDYTWQPVKKGDPLFTIYSPELVSTQREYLLALKSKKILKSSKYPEISDGSSNLVESTRKRLELWDIDESQIREIERTGKVKKDIVIYSPVSGHVSYKNAFENQYVEPDTLIYTIADHSTIWIEADIYEDEIPLVKVGQKATLTTEAFPGEQFEGRIVFKWPHLTPETRTTKVRFEFPNPDLKLLPEMYANIHINIPLGKKLSIPRSAVLRTGKEDLVFVDKGNGFMEIRNIKLGQKAGEYYEVIKGLKEGEKVVSQARFLIDSESRLQAAIPTWNEGEKIEMTPESRSKDSSQKGQPSHHIHQH